MSQRFFMAFAAVTLVFALGLSAAQDGHHLLVILDRGSKNAVTYRINGRLYSAAQLADVLGRIIDKEGHEIPVVLMFNRRVSLYEVGGVSGLLTKIGFYMPRCYMFDDEHSRVWEIELISSKPSYDYAEFMRDPFATGK